jgi:imidazolonepropionase-like amidohydrolase
MRMLKRYLFPVCLLAALLVSMARPFQSDAQRSAIETYAITNARIVSAAGPNIEKGTVVIRGGLIAAVGANVTAPADARVIDGTGLTIYPGLIDANTNLGIPQPAASPRPAGGPPATFQVAVAPITSALNSTQPAGLQPEILAEDYVRPGGGEIESARNAGITTALTSPRSGIFVGQSALINLAGETPQQMIVRSPVALHIGFRPLQGNYPGSLMGVFSAIRQAFLDAQRYQEAQRVYARSPRGVRRPDTDRSLEALLPALSREMPVVMYADREREILRALDLAQEFKLRAIIAGGEEAWKLADQLRDAGVPVLLTLNFPKRTTAASPEADPEPLRILRGRVEAPKSAGRLAAARVRFAFQSGGMTNMDDFRGNAAKAVENGLASGDAIKAMTISAAEILGVADRLGSIETGKIANLTIVRGDLLDRNAKVAYVFIDGRQIDLRPAPARPAESTGQVGTTPEEDRGKGASGTWAINLNFDNQNYPGTLVLRQQGSSLSGSITTQLGTSEFSNGTINANAIHVVTNANIQGQQMELTMDATVTGDSINGTMTTSLGSATFTGTRTP